MGPSCYICHTPWGGLSPSPWSHCHYRGVHNVLELISYSSNGVFRSLSRMDTLGNNICHIFPLWGAFERLLMTDWRFLCKISIGRLHSTRLTLTNITGFQLINVRLLTGTKPVVKVRFWVGGAFRGGGGSFLLGEAP